MNIQTNTIKTDYGSKPTNFVEATGNSKKNAEQAAATSLLNILNL